MFSTSAFQLGASDLETARAAGQPGGGQSVTERCGYTMTDSREPARVCEPRVAPPRQRRMSAADSCSCWYTADGQVYRV